MARKKNEHGGGAETNRVGLKFEEDTNLEKTLRKEGFRLETVHLRKNKNVSPKAFEVFDGALLVGYLVSQWRLYDYLEKIINSDYSGWKMPLSKRLRPDEAFVNLLDNTLYIVEKKTQSGSGSVDEKLQTFPFKIRQYNRLVKGIKINGQQLKVKYRYNLDHFFDHPDYDDLFEYMQDENLEYHLHRKGEIYLMPLRLIGLDILSDSRGVTAQQRRI